MEGGLSLLPIRGGWGEPTKERRTEERKNSAFGMEKGNDAFQGREIEKKRGFRGLKSSDGLEDRCAQIVTYD